MKYCITAFFLIFFTAIGMAQEDENEIAAISQDACICMEDIKINAQRAQRYEEIRSCISGAILAFQMKEQLMGMTEKVIDSVVGTNSHKTADTTTNREVTVVLDKNYEEIEEKLLRECGAMNALMTNDEPTSEVSISDKERAQASYVEGQLHFRNGDFEQAIKHFKKAVKRDKTFAFAWDMLGYSHRKNGAYEKAIECYERSIEIDPKGRMPLLNVPIAYEYMKQYQKAADGFQRFKDVFPEDPEGYYGSGRIYLILEDHEAALDNVMKAYVMYNEVNSPYARDAENKLSELYHILKENNNLDLFLKMAKKHKIQIE